jgi:hypothetical protein
MSGMEVRFFLGAPVSVFGEMDIISVFETEGGSSILSRPAKNICKYLLTHTEKDSIIYTYADKTALFFKNVKLVFCESGGMVYAADLKSAVERHTGSSPVSRTINYIVMENGCVH